MRIVAMSDPHGELPEPSKIPAGDLLLIAGDVCPDGDHSVSFQRHWLESTFREWLNALPMPPVRRIWIAGNHDFALELGGPGRRLGKAGVYLQDSFVEVDGLKVYGSPWSRVTGPWAFSLPESRRHRVEPAVFSSSFREQIAPGAGAAPRQLPGLEDVWRQIPDDADVVLVHNPPYRMGDLTLDGEHVGSPFLTMRLAEVAPRLVVCGHVHEARGAWKRDWAARESLIVNASILNAMYEPVYSPIVIDI